METAIQMFKFENKQEIRVVQGEDGEPWFVASGVCRALAYANTSKALSDHVDSEDIAYFKMLPGVVIGGITRSYSPGMASAINESGLYSLTFSSTLPEAKRFRKWVTSEVLPSIRKTGSYSTDRASEMSPTRALLAAVQQMVDIEERVANIEAKQREAEAALLALPEPTTPAPEKSLRAALNESVRSYAQSNGVAFPDAWSKVYKELKYRSSFDAATRAKNSGKTQLDEVEAAGLLPELYAIAREVLQ